MYPTAHFGAAIIEDRLRHYRPQPHRRLDIHVDHHPGSIR